MNIIIQESQTFYTLTIRRTLERVHPGYRRKSSITETEDVSYVSSAYVPQCLRYGGRPTLSNAHRAHESGVNTDNIRDELDEVITLNSVSIIVAEYIPFGANQVDLFAFVDMPSVELIRCGDGVSISFNHTYSNNPSSEATRKGNKSAHLKAVLNHHTEQSFRCSSRASFVPLRCFCFQMAAGPRHGFLDCEPQ